MKWCCRKHLFGLSCNAGNIFLHNTQTHLMCAFYTYSLNWWIYRVQCFLGRYHVRKLLLNLIYSHKTTNCWLFIAGCIFKFSLCLSPPCGQFVLLQTSSLQQKKCSDNKTLISKLFVYSKVCLFFSITWWWHQLLSLQTVYSKPWDWTWRRNHSVVGEEKAPGNYFPGGSF